MELSVSFINRDLENNRFEQMDDCWLLVCCAKKYVLFGALFIILQLRQQEVHHLLCIVVFDFHWHNKVITVVWRVAFDVFTVYWGWSCAVINPNFWTF